MKKIVLCMALSGLFSSAIAQSPGERLKELQENFVRGDLKGLTEEQRKAFKSAEVSSAGVMRQLEEPKQAIRQMIELNEQWTAAYKDAYVQAVPPKDKALASQVLKTGHSPTNSTGQLYIFVSRSMPLSLLKAYAVDSMYLGAPLVVKGIRPGATLKEYVEEAIEEYNSVEGQSLGAMEINPNLFEMFGVDVVPSIVWTNRIDLGDSGSGCDTPEMVGQEPENIKLKGPQGQWLEAPKPTCLPAPQESYYKISGSVNMHYALEQFEAAGMPKEALLKYKRLLAEKSSVYQGTQSAIGSAQPGVLGEFKIDSLPTARLKEWQYMLREGKRVQRSPWGPVFDSDAPDDGAYRKELETLIAHQLGVR